MAASASSSQVPCGKYDVFISFRGPDVRSGFLSHLEEKLRRKEIDVYVDDRLEGGEEVSSALVKAIERSMIALVIFSKDYASSKWCLEELVKIMECKEADQQIVIPVFYRVDPSDVRLQTRTYAEAFTRHEEEFKDKVEIWRSVLNKSADLSGYHSSEFRNDAKLIDAIVEHVLKKVEENTPIVPKCQLIGSHENLTSVETLMKIESLEVRIVGIWGMGGIGKTTLARAIFDKFLHKFESHCFLENVREKSTKVDGLSSLREELFYELLGQKDKINMNHAMRRLQRKKVLIVLDDVDNSKHLKDLAGQQRLHLGPGSRVIVTSRDKHVLRSGGIHVQFIHGVNELSSKESLELFSIHAFNQSHPKMGYQELSKMTVAIAGGIPLALEVLGCHFHSRDEAYWGSELSKLKKCPLKEIEDVLKISYDGLNAVDQEIFLDIAFFYVGQREDAITRGLEACGFEAVSGIQNLRDKALIKSNGFGYIVMHDLIKKMAVQIVRKDRIPKRRSRLKDADEICDILKSNMETSEIEGIVLKARQKKYPQCRADFFTKMKNLRIIRLLASIELPFGLDSFPNKLRYLEWFGYPLESLPLGSYLENLVELHLECSKVKKLWDGKQEDLANIKQINLCGSEQLMELPDLSKAHRLEIIDLDGCSNLRSIHPSILSLHSIVKMNVSNCRKLESLESETHLESLSILEAQGCYSLKRFCVSSKKLRDIALRDSKVELLRFPIGRFTEIRELAFNGERLTSLPIDELCGLTNLQVFEVPNFKQVIDTKKLHTLFDAWRNLRRLCLERWSNLSEIPDSIRGLTKLEYLSLKESAVETLPASVNHLSSLTHISLKHCKRLKSILGLPPFLQELDASCCTLLETVSSDSLPQNPRFFRFVECLKLDEPSLRFIEELTQFSTTSAIYPGSKVPEWMKYKPASNAIQFTCNLERLHALALCCVATACEFGSEYHCFVSFDDYTKQYCHDGGLEMQSDHVFLWHTEGGLCSPGTNNEAEISCKFYFFDDEFYQHTHGDEDPFVDAAPCGVHLKYYSELEPESKLEP